MTLYTLFWWVTCEFFALKGWKLRRVPPIGYYKLSSKRSKAFISRCQSELRDLLHTTTGFDLHLSPILFTVKNCIWPWMTQNLRLSVTANPLSETFVFIYFGWNYLKFAHACFLNYRQRISVPPGFPPLSVASGAQSVSKPGSARISDFGSHSPTWPRTHKAHVQ